jgi:hypothetical protein
LTLHLSVVGGCDDAGLLCSAVSAQLFVVDDDSEDVLNARVSVFVWWRWWRGCDGGGWWIGL